MAWSSDGRYILYERFVSPLGLYYRFGSYMAMVDTRSGRTMTLESDQGSSLWPQPLQAVWSPNGRWLALKGWDAASVFDCSSPANRLRPSFLVDFSRGNLLGVSPAGSSHGLISGPTNHLLDQNHSDSRAPMAWSADSKYLHLITANDGHTPGLAAVNMAVMQEYLRNATPGSQAPLSVGSPSPGCDDLFTISDGEPFEVTLTDDPHRALVESGDGVSKRICVVDLELAAVAAAFRETTVKGMTDEITDIIRWSAPGPKPRTDSSLPDVREWARQSTPAGIRPVELPVPGLADAQISSDGHWIVLLAPKFRAISIDHPSTAVSLPQASPAPYFRWLPQSHTLLQWGKNHQLWITDVASDSTREVSLDNEQVVGLSADNRLLLMLVLSSGAGPHQQIGRRLPDLFHPISRAIPLANVNSWSERS